MEREGEILIRAANAVAGGLFALVFLMTVAKHVLARRGIGSGAVKWTIYAAIALAVLHGCQSYVRTGSVL